MRRIIAVVARDRADAVIKALVAKGVTGVTLEDTAADALPAGPESSSSRAQPSVRIEVVIESHRADEVIESVETIMNSTFVPAPYRVIVEDVELVVRIRSGEVLS